MQLGHAINGFDVWTRAFDTDPVRKQAGGRSALSGVPDDPHYIVVDLEFDSSSEAQAVRAALSELWRSRKAAPALAGAPNVRLVPRERGS